MKGTHILLVDRVNSSINMGGDTVQITAIADYLKKSGYNVHVSSDVNTFIKKQKDIDLIIFFNLTNPYELLNHWYLIKEKGVPYVVFPIYWNLEKVIPWNVHIGLWRKIIHSFPEPFFNGLRWGKTLLKEKNWRIPSYYKLFFLRREVRKFLIDAEGIFVNSEAERYHLIKEFKLHNFSRTIKVIRNGIEEELFFSNYSKEKCGIVLPFKDYICCAGGIGPRKNQLNLVKAANKSNINLIIIGRPSKGTAKYYDEINNIKNRNIHIIGHLDRIDLLEVLSNARGHIQPSFIETPGLVSLEAAALGCKICVSDVGPVREYFGDLAIYCDPSNIESIKDSLLELWNGSLSEGERKNQINQIYKLFSWSNVLKPLEEEIKRIMSEIHFSQ